MYGYESFSCIVKRIFYTFFYAVIRERQRLDPYKEIGARKVPFWHTCPPLLCVVWSSGTTRFLFLYPLSFIYAFFPSSLISSYCVNIVLYVNTRQTLYIFSVYLFNVYIFTVWVDGTIVVRLDNTIVVGLTNTGAATGFITSSEARKLSY